MKSVTFKCLIAIWHFSQSWCSLIHTFHTCLDYCFSIWQVPCIVYCQIQIIKGIIGVPTHNNIFQDHWVLSRPFINSLLLRPLHSFIMIYQVKSFKTIFFFQNHLSIHLFQDHYFLSRPFSMWNLSRPFISWFLSRPFISLLLSRPLASFKTIYQFFQDYLVLSRPVIN